MDAILDYLLLPLGWIMDFCYNIAGNYGIAVIIFTLISKVILIPVSLWVHKNSIKLVKMQPDINKAKINFYGDPDALADEQTRIYKEGKYNPLVSLIPLAIQILLLLGVIGVIYHPFDYILGFSAQVSDELVTFTSGLGIEGFALESSSVQLSVLEAVQNPEFADAFASLSLTGVNTVDIMEQIRGINMSFMGLSLTSVPSVVGGITLLSPIIAGFSAWLLCYAQNKLNVLQSEQGKINQYGTMALSVGISLYLGFFVAMGVALYWIASNILTVVQLFILNKVISPAKHVDFEALEASKAELAAIEKMGAKRDKDLIKREKADYKRFFSIANKHLVFYSESNGFYKYFEGTIAKLLANTNVIIHYVTSDPEDNIFKMAESEPRIKAYYIGEKKLITLFMKMDADVVVMTMSDLGNYHYKRSYLRKDIEYVYMFHYPLSTHMVLHTGALDHYDTILCVGEFQFDEIRKTEEIYGLPEKKLISCGYGQLEKLHNEWEKSEKIKGERPKVLVAPSWQTDNILDSCIDELLSALLGKGFDVVVRPHPEYVKRYRPRMDAIVERYKSYDGGDLSFELDFTSNSSIFDSDAVITDWSGTAYEFSFVTLKPAVFVDTPPKIHNPEYVKLGIEPLEFSLRNQMGIRVRPGEMEGLADRLKNLFNEGDSFNENILELRNKYIANFGKSSEVAYKYIVNSIIEKTKAKKTK